MSSTACAKHGHPAETSSPKPTASLSEKSIPSVTGADKSGDKNDDDSGKADDGKSGKKTASDEKDDDSKVSDLKESERKKSDKPTGDPKAAAVALNFCRASMHRIRKDPTKQVLWQEQEKILNNLNLERIVDQEVIQLYTGMLQEINEIGVAEHEREAYKHSFTSNVNRKALWDTISFGADLASVQFGSALKTGASSWWDNRSLTFQKDVELIKIDKQRMTAVVQKSTLFLDTFWKLAQRKHIPDRWLVRGDDLDSLEAALKERDPEVRIRVLKRMEPFMTAYPPYWYYLGRAQQEQGQLFAAANTFEQLRELGDGHFRKDDMLATALANRAAIQEFLGQSNAPETAHQALTYSTESWEANLVCARVLQRHKRVVAAEDAILRNIDVGLEKPHSRACLAWLYYSENENVKLTKMLTDHDSVVQLPAPSLLRYAARLGKDTPKLVMETVQSSLDGEPHQLIGPDEFVLRAAPGWQLHLAKSVKLMYDGQELALASSTNHGNRYQLRFAGKADWGGPFTPPPPKLKFQLQLAYEDQTNLQLTLGAGGGVGGGGVGGGGSNPNLSGTDIGIATTAPHTPTRLTANRLISPTFRITAIQVGEARVAIDPEIDPPKEIEALSPDGGSVTK